MSEVTQHKINQLLAELRTWEPGEQRHTLHELAKMFDLDVFVVDRIAKSEGLSIRSGWKIVDEGDEIVVDPNSTTLDLDPEKVEKALKEPDPDPDWVDADRESGSWVKKPTGEWVRLEDDDEG